MASEQSHTALTTALATNHSNRDVSTGKHNAARLSPSAIGKAGTTATHESPPHDASGTTESQVQTKYEAMLLALDDIPILHSMLAGFFTWVLLAGFLLFPGTFTSLQKARSESTNAVEQAVLSAIAHVPLFVIAWLCTGIGAAGMIWLWWRWMNNYIWISNKIFIPGFLNGLAGIITTLVNVFGVHDGEFSSAGKVTIVVTSGTAIICGALLVIYNLWLLRGVKREHSWAMGKERAGVHGEGRVDLSKRRTVASAKA